ncbi:hypothetical protein D3C72_2031880 [compost metagenome]
MAQTVKVPMAKNKSMILIVGMHISVSYNQKLQLQLWDLMYVGLEQKQVTAEIQNGVYCLQITYRRLKYQKIHNRK